MHVIICGGRDFRQYAFMFRKLDVFRKTRVEITHIIHGDARGADLAADVYADIHGIPVTRFPADWQAHGKAAGGIRNKQMLEEGNPALVIAFPGGRGTDDMKRRAKEAGIPVWDVKI